MNLTVIDSMFRKLAAADVPFTTEDCNANGFHGMRFIFRTRKDFNAAKKVLPTLIISRYNKFFAVEIY